MLHPTVITVAFALAVALIIKYISKTPASHSTRPRHLRNSTQCREILKTSTVEQRAPPNQRLVTAFGINNAFTTFEVAYAKFFVARSKALLVTSSSDWKTLEQFASDRAKQLAVDKLQTSNPFRLLPVVQTFVFQVVIRKFFPYVSMPSDEDVGFVTSRINSLWIASKEIARDVGQLVKQKEELHGRLKSMFGSSEWQSDKDNPLNTILPAYETLWRVVLRIYLEVRFLSSPQQAHEYIAQLELFLAEPTKAKFEEKTQTSDGMLVSVKSIVAEGLRLYPPTRRIYREIKGEQVAVDIEYLHRDATEWGADAMKFIPGRWKSLSNAQAIKRGYMPFGAVCFECPAKPQFGPFIIGILVGVMVTDFGDRFELIGGDDLQQPLENGRDAYSELELQKKS